MSVTSGDVVAETTMRYRGSDVSIRVCRPVRAAPGEPEFHCHFSIAGGGELDYNGRSIGLDSMQALILSLRWIGTYIQNNERVDAASIEWPGGGLEFPEFDRLR